jgi:hypothetical protein
MASEMAASMEPHGSMSDMEMYRILKDHLRVCCALSAKRPFRIASRLRTSTAGES